jgi:hypothetical protein
MLILLQCESVAAEGPAETEQFFSFLTGENLETILFEGCEEPVTQSENAESGKEEGQGQEEQEEDEEGDDSSLFGSYQEDDDGGNSYGFENMPEETPVQNPTQATSDQSYAFEVAGQQMPGAAPVQQHPSQTVHEQVPTKSITQQSSDTSTSIHQTNSDEVSEEEFQTLYNQLAHLDPETLQRMVAQMGPAVQAKFSKLLEQAELKTKQTRVPSTSQLVSQHADSENQSGINTGAQNHTAGLPTPIPHVPESQVTQNDPQNQHMNQPTIHPPNTVWYDHPQSGHNQAYQAPLQGAPQPGNQMQPQHYPGQGQFGNQMHFQQNPMQGQSGNYLQYQQGPTQGQYGSPMAFQNQNVNQGQIGTPMQSQQSPFHGGMQLGTPGLNITPLGLAFAPSQFPGNLGQQSNISPLPSLGQPGGTNTPTMAQTRPFQHPATSQQTPFLGQKGSPRVRTQNSRISKARAQPQYQAFGAAVRASPKGSSSRTMAYGSLPGNTHEILTFLQSRKKQAGLLAEVETTHHNFQEIRKVSPMGAQLTTNAALAAGSPCQSSLSFHQLNAQLPLQMQGPQQSPAPQTLDPEQQIMHLFQQIQQIRTGQTQGQPTPQLQYLHLQTPAQVQLPMSTQQSIPQQFQQQFGQPQPGPSGQVQKGQLVQAQGVAQVSQQIQPQHLQSPAQGQLPLNNQQPVPQLSPQHFGQPQFGPSSQTHHGQLAQAQGIPQMPQQMQPQHAQYQYPMQMQVNSQRNQVYAQQGQMLPPQMSLSGHQGQQASITQSPMAAPPITPVKSKVQSKLKRSTPSTTSSGNAGDIPTPHTSGHKRRKAKVSSSTATNGSSPSPFVSPSATSQSEEVNPYAEQDAAFNTIKAFNKNWDLQNPDKAWRTYDDVENVTGDASQNTNTGSPASGYNNGLSGFANNDQNANFVNGSVNHNDTNHHFSANGNSQKMPANPLPSAAKTSMKQTRKPKENLKSKAKAKKPEDEPVLMTAAELGLEPKPYIPIDPVLQNQGGLIPTQDPYPEYLLDASSDAQLYVDPYPDYSGPGIPPNEFFGPDVNFQFFGIPPHLLRDD